jgi:HK97 family phage prohead protease
MKYFNVPAEYKAAGDTGSFSGYAAIFGNVDLGGDVIERGAFKEIVRTKAGKVVTLWQHDSRQPVGVAEVTQDDTGLAFTGQLVMEDATARKAHAHMKAGSVEGMSIGYDVLAGGAEMLTSGVRKLTGLKLWEISVVTWGMNPLAQIGTVKQYEKQISTIRDFEDFLRDVGGFSNAQAKLLASGGWRTLQLARDGSSGEGDTAAKGILDFLSTIK